MRQVTVTTVISAPREEVFDFVADLSKRPAFCDHFMREYRLARANPRGLGAAARFQIRLPLAQEWAEITVKAHDRPRRLVEEGPIGRFGRSRLVAVYDFIPEAAGATRVELTVYADQRHFVDRIKHFGATASVRRRFAKALRRLRDLFEEGRVDQVEGAAVAGYDPGKAPRFGDHIQPWENVAVADR